MPSKHLLLLSFFLFNLFTLQAQKELIISLDEVLKKVEENNYTIKISEKEYRAAKADFNISNSILLPTISVSHAAISTTNPLMAFGSKLNQEIVTQSDFIPELLNNPNNTKNFTTKIEVQQPIFNADGLYLRKAAKAKMNAVELQSFRTKSYMQLQITKSYMQLQLAYKAVKVLQKATTAAIENQQVAKNNFKQGYLLKADLLLLQIHVTEIKNKLQNAKSNIVNASDNLIFLMGQTSNVILKPSTQLIAEVNLEIYNQQFSTSRTDIEAMQFSVDAYNNKYNASKFSYLPRLNAFGSYELYDDKLFGTNAKGYLVGAQLSWNIFEGYKRIGKTRKSKAEFDKAILKLAQYKNKSHLEFNKTKRQLKDVENKLHLTSLAVEHANEALRIRSNRFKQGLEKSSDLLIAETQYSQKQLEYFQTVFSYNFTKAYLAFLTK